MNKHREEIFKRAEILLNKTIAQQICDANKLPRVKQTFIKKIINNIKYKIWRAKVFIEYIKDYNQY